MRNYQTKLAWQIGESLVVSGLEIETRLLGKDFSLEFCNINGNIW